MKKLILILALLIPAAANASTLHETKSHVKNGVTVAWFFEFYFTKPPSKEHGSYFVEEFACQPSPSGSASLLLACFNSQEDATKAAKKEVDRFEYGCRHRKECDVDKIAARHKKKVIP